MASRRRGGDPRPGLRTAIRTMDEALRYAPGHQYALARRGQARLDLGMAEEGRGGDPRECFRHAVVDLEAVLRSNPRDFISRKNLGLCCYRLACAENAAGEESEALSFSIFLTSELEGYREPCT